MWIDDDAREGEQRGTGEPGSGFIVAEADDYGDLENDFDDFDEDDFDDDFDDDFEEELDDEYDVENEEFPDDDFQEVEVEALPGAEFDEEESDEATLPGTGNGDDFEADDDEEFSDE